MTVESNYVIAVAMLSDWFERLAFSSGVSFSANENQNKNQSHHVRVIFPRFERVTGNC